MSEVASFIQTNYYSNPYAYPFLISAFFVVAVGFYVLKQAVRSGLHQSFFAICFSLSVWLFTTGFLLLSRDPWWIRFWINGLYSAVSVMPVTMFHHSAVWLGFRERQKKLIWAGYFLGLLLLPLLWFTPVIVTGYMKHSWGHYSLLSNWGGGLFLAFFAFYMLGFFRNLIKGYLEAKIPLKKKQTGIVLAAFLVGYIGIVDFLPCYRIDIFPIGAFTTLLWVTTLAYTIVRYKLLDIQTVIHKTFLWLMTTVVFLLPVVSLTYFFHTWLFHLSSALFTFLIFCLMVAFIPYVRFIQPYIDQWFHRRRWNLNQVFQQFTDELVHLKSLEDLANHILQTIKKTMYPEDMNLLLLDEGGEECLVFTSEGKALKIDCQKNQNFFRFLGSYNTVILTDYAEIDPRLEPVREEAREHFHDSNAKVCIPIVLEEKLIGIIYLGSKSNLKNYSAAEIRFLSDLRGSAAIAISNSLRLIVMQANLRKWNEELDRQVRERTKELKEAQAQLIQAEKLATIGTLAGGVAHEINNPLAAILTNAQMLLADDLAGDARESIELIEEAAERCRIIVQKLMKYSRKSPEEAALQTVDLNDVIEHSISFLRYQLEQENIKVTTDLKAETPIQGNTNELSQVFTNLILNAKDALQNRQGGGEIKIGTKETAKEVTAEVEDNGFGIPPDILPKIFDPFFTTKDVGKGTGLGLSITQGIVQKHGGRIDAKSKLNIGTTITIAFPKSTAEKK